VPHILIAELVAVAVCEAGLGRHVFERVKDLMRWRRVAFVLWVVTEDDLRELHDIRAAHGYPFARV
jgi:hypothetical protein